MCVRVDKSALHSITECYAAGKPLDKCIELKELNMAKRSAKAQKKMLLKKKKVEEEIEKRYHAPSKSETVFDFLNDRVFLKKGK